MSTYIGIGLIYQRSDFSSAEREMEKILFYLLSNKGSVTEYHYALDQYGTRWMNGHQLNRLDYAAFSKAFVGGYYGKVNLHCPFLSLEDMNVSLYYQQTDDRSFGFLLDLSQQELAEKHYTAKDFDIDIFGFFKDFYKHSTFDYGFCNYQAYIQSPFDTFEKWDAAQYPVSFIPAANGEASKVIFKGWDMDEPA